MSFEYTYRHRVTFSETDMAGIVHFSNFFRYLEMAEHAFFRSLGHSVHPRDEKVRSGWPRVKAHCEFLRPVRFEDEIDIRILVSEKTSKSLSYLGSVSVVDDSPVLCAIGGITTVRIRFNPEDGRMRATDIPSEIDNKISVAPPELCEGLLNHLKRR